MKGELANAGPKRPGVDDSVKFNPGIERVEGELARTAPVYRDVSDNVKYCPETQRIPGEKATPYPVLAGDQTKNQFTPNPPTKVDADVKMEGPIYQG